MGETIAGLRDGQEYREKKNDEEVKKWEEESLKMGTVAYKIVCKNGLLHQ